MRIIFYIIFMKLLYSQDVPVFIGKSYSNDSILNAKLIELHQTVYSDNLLQDIVQNRLLLDKSLHKYFSTIKILDVSTSEFNDSIFIHFNMFYKSSKISKIDSVAFKGLIYSNNEKLLRELRYEQGQIINPSELIIFKDYLKYSPFVEHVNTVDVYKKNNNSLYVMFDIKENQTAFFNGIFGYNPNDDKVKFTSDVQFVFQNINGSGRSIDVNWKKSSTSSEEIKVSYLEPWFLSLPINQLFTIHHKLQDSIYTQLELSTISEYRLNHRFKISFGIGTNKIVPIDSIIADNYQLPIQNEFNLSLGLNYNNMDRKFNPKNGYQFSTKFLHKNSSQNNPKWLINRYNLSRNYSRNNIVLDASYFKELYQNNVLYLKYSSYIMNNINISESDYTYFGGTKSLRGFRENQFKSINVHFLTLEYRFIISDYSRLFLYSDYALFQKYKQNSYEKRNGLGVGIRFDSKIGIIGLDYGFESDKLFKDSKIHIGIYGTID